MITYYTLEDGSITGNGYSSIPVNHRFYKEALSLVESGEAEILPYSEPALTQEQYTSAIQEVMDAQARSMGYDSIASAVTYADEPSVPSFQEEGQELRAWRSLVWATGYQLLANQQDGEPQPTIQEVLDQLPVFGE